MITKEYARQVLKEYKESLMKIPGVISVGLSMIGESYVISVRTFGDVSLPKEIKGVPVRAIKQYKQPSFLTGYREKYRPVPMGVSIGTKEYTFTNPFTGLVTRGAPTVSSGFYAVDRQGTFLITCAHLWWYAAIYTLQKAYGQLPPSELKKLPAPYIYGEICVQPGYADGGRETDKIGILSKYALSPVGSGVDGSSIKLDLGSFMSESLPDGTKVSGVAEPEIGEQVYLVGRTTGVSQGIIREVDVETRLYNPLEAYDATITGSFIAELHSQQGDSGGPILNSKNQVLGLCSAGDGSFTTIGTRADLILEKLDVGPPFKILIPKALPIFFAGSLGVLALSYILRRR